MPPEIRSFHKLCFVASIPCQSRHLTVRRMRTVSKSATFLATESVNSAPIKRGETEVQIFWQGKAQNSSPILRCTFLARRSAKPRVHKNKSMQRLISSLWGPGTAKFQVIRDFCVLYKRVYRCGSAAR